MFLPRCLHVLCKTRCFQVDRLRIFVFFVHRFHRQKEYCLFFCSIFDLPVSILNLWWSVNWLHIRRDKCTRRNHPESKHCLVMKDQWDCVLIDLEELGGKEFLLKDRYNTKIFSCFLLFLPRSHMTVLFIFTCVMNVWNQSIQAFVTGSGPFCDWSCKLVHWP